MTLQSILPEHQAMTHLDQVDDGEAVFDIGPCVGDTEVKPLHVFGGVEISPQPQLILILPPTSMNHNLHFPTNMNHNSYSPYKYEPNLYSPTNMNHNSYSYSPYKYEPQLTLPYKHEPQLILPLQV